MRHKTLYLSLVFILAIVVQNCKSGSVRHTGTAQIQSIIQTDVEALPIGPQRERIASALSGAAKTISKMENEIKKLSIEKNEALEDAGKWRGLSGLAWFLIIVVGIWVIWKVFKFFRPNISI